MSENSTKPPSFFLPSLLLGAGIALGFKLLGSSLYKMGNVVMDQRVITIRGLAEEEVKSDLAVFKFSVISDSDSAQSAYAQSKIQATAAIELLMQNGFTEHDFIMDQGRITDRGLDSSARKDVEKDKRYSTFVRFTIKTRNVEGVKNLNQKIVAPLIAKGINIEQDPVRFIYSNFLPKRHELVAKAALDAQSAAQHFSQKMNVNLVGLRTMHQGGVEILSGDLGEEEHRYGGDSAIVKKLRVVVTTTWNIEPKNSMTNAQKYVPNDGKIQEAQEALNNT